jgi:hypothetical protein
MPVVRTTKRIHNMSKSRVAEAMLFRSNKIQKRECFYPRGIEPRALNLRFWLPASAYAGVANESVVTQVHRRVREFLPSNCSFRREINQSQ